MGVATMDNSSNFSKKASSKGYQTPDIPEFLLEESRVEEPCLEYDAGSTIRKEVTLNYDGKQLFIRIPSAISKFYGLKKGDRMELFVKTDPKSPGNNRKIALSLKVIEDEPI